MTSPDRERPRRLSAAALASSAADDDRVVEPTPWGLGIIVTIACALFATFLLVGVYELIGGLVPWLGVAAVVVVTVGLGWTLWDLRDRPVWRWIVWGSLIGLLAGSGSAVALLALGR
jgi:VIT1/CCC1 family predicted Fe2+/Mn2+ transporter